MRLCQEEAPVGGDGCRPKDPVMEGGGPPEAGETGFAGFRGAGARGDILS